MIFQNYFIQLNFDFILFFIGTPNHISGFPVKEKKKKKEIIKK
jgi:hypothetical protein